MEAKRRRDSSYRRLPKPEGYTFQNRFVGDYLACTAPAAAGEHPKSQNSETSMQCSGPVATRTTFKLAHGVDRIEQMGSGRRGGWHGREESAFHLGASRRVADSCGPLYRAGRLARRAA